MSHFQGFKEEYISVMDKARKEFNKCPWDDKAYYTRFVGQLYHFVCHSTRMIPFAASYFKPNDEAYFNRCIEHSHEERGHHLMALNDLKNLGSNPKDHPVLNSTERLYGYPYWVIANVDPIAIFGISAYMEGLSIEVGKDFTTKIVDMYGKKCASFLTSHTADDEDHIKEVFAALEACPEQRIEVVRRTFLGSSDNFLGILKDCKKA